MVISNTGVLVLDQRTCRWANVNDVGPARSHGWAVLVGQMEYDGARLAGRRPPYARLLPLKQADLSIDPELNSRTLCNLYARYWSLGLYGGKEASQYSTILY